MFCQQNLSRWFLIWKARRNWTALLPCFREGKRHSKQRCSLPLPWVPLAIRIPFLPFPTLDLRDRSRTCDKPLLWLCSVFATCHICSGWPCTFRIGWLTEVACHGRWWCILCKTICVWPWPLFKVWPPQKELHVAFCFKDFKHFSCHTAISHLTMMYVPCFFVCNTHTWWGAF